MSNNWPIVPLKDVLSLTVDAVPVDASATYPISGVYSFGRGLFARQPIMGTETTYKFLHRLHRDDFVLSQLKGWEGALARVTNTFDGWFLSPQFQTFRTLPNLLDISYLEWYCKLPTIWDELKNKSHGIGARRDSVYPAQFLSLSIPLPPLGEQQRIVARIEELAAKIEEARRLYSATDKDIYSALLSKYSSITQDVQRFPMKEVAPLKRRPVEVESGTEYYELGIRSFGKGTFHKTPITGAALGTKRIFKIEPQDLLFNIVFAWEGAVAVARPEDEGRVGSHRFLTCVPKIGLATSPFLYFHFLTEEGLQQLLDASPGSAGRNRTLGIKALEEIIVPVPPFEKQLEFDTLQAKFNQVKYLHTQCSAELDALLPSVLDKAFKGEL